MNLDDFFKILRNNAERIEWFVHDCGPSRFPRHVLRCKVTYQTRMNDGQMGRQAMVCCPITAACLIAKQAIYGLEYYRVAGSQLFLDAQVTADIADVGDAIACPARSRQARDIRSCLLTLAGLNDDYFKQLPR